MLVMAGKYRAQGLSARTFCDLPSLSALVPPSDARRPERPDTGLMPVSTKIASLHRQSIGLFALAAPHLQWCLSGPDSLNFRRQFLEMRGRLSLRQKR